MPQLQLSTELFQNLITRHGLCLLFAQLLEKQQRKELISPFMLQQSRALVHRYLSCAQQLINLINHFKQANIDSAVLKGIPLNKQLFGELCLREVRDIDFMINPEHILSAHQCLIKLGFKLEYPPINPENFINNCGLLTKYIQSFTYMHTANQVVIDLHWHLSTVNYYDIENLRNIKTANILILSQNVSILTAEQNFYYLCAHAAKHCWWRLKWLIDVAMFAQKVPFCLNGVIALAQQKHAIRPVLEASILLDKFFQIKIGDIPHTWLDKILVNFRIKFIRKLLVKDMQNPNKRIKFAILLINLILLPKLKQKCHYIIKICLLRKNSIKLIGKFKKTQWYKSGFYEN